MKILELCLSRGHGGLELYPIKIIEWLGKDLDEVTTIVAPESFISFQLDEKGISYKTLDCNSIYETIVGAIKIGRVIRTKRIDILHINSGPDLKLAVLSKILSFSNVKLIYTRHLEIERLGKDNREIHKKYKGLYHRILFRYVDLFIGVTQKVVNEALRHLPLPGYKIKLLYNGIPDAPLYDQSKCDEYISSLGVSKEDFKIGQFSRIEHEKGQHIVVEAVSNLISKGMKVKHVMIGNVSDNTYFSELKETIDRKGINHAVKYLEYHPDPMQIMGCFDVIVVASYAETFGLVLAEAMRCGTLVIGTNNGGIPEIIDHNKNGFLFEPGNAIELTVLLEKTITDRAFRNKISVEGKRKADRLFSQKKHFDDLRAICNELD